jgi:hypothetical protein
VSATCPIASIVLEVYNNQLEKESPEPIEYNDDPEPSFKILPNPAKSSFRIITEAAVESIKILTANGQPVKSIHSPINFENEIEIQELSSGIYLIAVTYENGITETKQLVVQQ